MALTPQKKSMLMGNFQLTNAAGNETQMKMHTSNQK